MRVSVLYFQLRFSRFFNSKKSFKYIKHIKIMFLKISSIIVAVKEFSAECLMEILY